MILGSAQPRNASITGRRPRRATASATAPGKLPPPQMIATGSRPGPESAAATLRSSGRIVTNLGRLSPCARPHQWPLAASPDKRNDSFDQWVSGKVARDGLDTLGEPALGEE